MTMNKPILLEITSQTKLFDVLEAFPELEEQIIKIAPPFKNLRNPVLRKTVGKLSTIEKVAEVGGMSVTNLVNTLRRAVGQGELTDRPAEQYRISVPHETSDPEWTTGEPAVTINGDEMLARGEVPLGVINEHLGNLPEGGFLLLVTAFLPSPIVDAMQKQEREVYSKAHPLDESKFLTFIRK